MDYKGAPPPGLNPSALPTAPAVNAVYFQPAAAPQVPVSFIRAPIFGPGPTVAHCPKCKQSTQTRVVRRATGKTHLIALALCVFCCCCYIPCVYCCNTCRVTNHHCKVCDTYVGSYSTM